LRPTELSNMSAPSTRQGDAYNFDNGHLPAQNEQHATSSIAQASVSRIPQAHTTELLFGNGQAILNLPTFLGNLKKVSKTSQQLAVTRCLNSVMGGNKSPWKAYPGHNKLLTLDMDINGGRHADQFHSTLRTNEEVEDWLQWRIQPNIEKRGQRSSRARLKLLFVTLTGGETASSNATDDANVLKDVFEKWCFPTAALSVLLDRRATFIDQQTAPNTFKKADERSTTSTNRVLCAGMKQWVMVWSPDPQDPPLGARGVVLCVDKTWASSVPGVVLQYLKTMWMFLGFQGVLPLVACMTSLRYAASALAEDDKEAFRREFELRAWLKRGFVTEKKDLGYTSAQVSWLSSRVSRHRDRLLVTDRMLSILKDDLDIYEMFAPTHRFEILRNCICSLADMKEHLRFQARQLEAQANVQLAALFNLTTQKDSATALLIAKTSQTIAADSRKDQKVSVDIANSSRLIAYNTLRDSASMKAIANVTMVFLPGTFMASVFAMPFFSSQKTVGFFVSGRIWIYVVITLPLTLATLACAWAWHHFSARSHRALQGDGNEESQQQLDRRSLEYPTQYQEYTPRPAEKDIVLSAYTHDEDRQDASSQLDMDLKQEDFTVHKNEHWDPMTREFAPSVFAASIFAISDDSSSAQSNRAEAKSVRSGASNVSLCDVVKVSRSEGSAWQADAAEPSITNTNIPSKIIVGGEAGMLRRSMQHERDKSEGHAGSRRPHNDWAESDESEAEVTVITFARSNGKTTIKMGSRLNAKPTTDITYRPADLTLPAPDTIRAYVCTTCEKSFPRLEALKRHERSHKKGESITCPACTRSFARPGPLLRHQERMHSANATSNSRYEDMMESEYSSSREQSPRKRSPNGQTQRSLAESDERDRGRDPFRSRDSGRSHAGYSC
jgi:DNA-directed RNA polymerase subunit RPC12/RpoP